LHNQTNTPLSPLKKLVLPLLLNLLLFLANALYYYQDNRFRSLPSRLLPDAQTSQKYYKIGSPFETVPLITAYEPINKSGGNLLLNKYFSELGLISWEDTSGFTEVRLTYASQDNFFKIDFYEGLNKCYLHPDALKKLEKTAQFLSAEYPDYRLLICDCVRPISVQAQMYELVKGTHQQRYIDSPKSISPDNMGLAIHVTLTDKTGEMIDMGSFIDSLTILSDPAYEEYFIKLGKLNQKQLANRKILRQVMEAGGWVRLASEWWHFGADMGKDKNRYKAIP